MSDGMPVGAGWRPDLADLTHLRYHDGDGSTVHVMADAVPRLDPLEAASPPQPLLESLEVVPPPAPRIASPPPTSAAPVAADAAPLVLSWVVAAAVVVGPFLSWVPVDSLAPDRGASPAPCQR